MKQNKKGSALIWSMAVIMIMMVLITSVLSVALSYIGNSLHVNQQRQAYLTALSAVNVLTEQVNDEVNRKSLIPVKYGEEGVIHIPSVEMGEQMGECSAKLERRQEEVNGKKEDRLLITATSKVHEQTYTMRAVLALTSGPSGPGRPEEPEEPKQDKYFRGGLYFTNIPTTSNDSILGPFTSGKNMDLYYDTETGNEIAFNAAWHENDSIVLNGNVLSNQSLKFEAELGNTITVNGNIICGSRSEEEAIYSKSAVSLYGAVTVNGNIYSRGQLTMGADTVIKGDLVAGNIWIMEPDSTEITGGIKTKSGKVRVGYPGTETDTVKTGGKTIKVGKIDATPNVLPEVKLKSYPASSEVSGAKKLDNASFSQGLQGGSTYVVSGTSAGSADQPLKVSGTGDVVVYIPKGQTLHFEALEDSSALPRVYFVLEDRNTSKLKIHENGEQTGKEAVCGAHIVGTGTVSIGQNTVFQGTCTLKSGIFHTTGKVRMEYAKPTSERYSPTIEATDLTDSGIFGEGAETEETDINFFPGIYDLNPDASLQKATLDCDYYYGGTKQHEFGSVNFQRNVFSKGDLKLLNTTIGGKLVSDGNLSLENGSVIKGGVYTTGAVKANGACTFQNGISAKEIDFGDVKQTVSGELRTESGKVSYYDRMSGKRVETSNYYGIPVSKLSEPLESKVPPYTPPTVSKPASGTMMELTRSMVSSSKKTPIGDAGNKDTYYKVGNGANLSGGELYVQGTGNIYIFLDDTQQIVRFDSIKNIDPKNTNTHVYLILNDGVSLYFNRDNTGEYYAHILGTGSEVKMKGELYGSITSSASLQWIGNNPTVHYAPSDVITPPEQGGAEEENPEDVWKILYYERGDAS